ncbi:hypothetical protein DASC09_012950 [Saccharomycopsis crataegensis]|uniref:Uncharacterized protein n=1 Tax=Saccharomycopsis crataegensis TaxID=43959 RepID=A0AAV5QGA8_9ASCO|nr:hypothetical protein DASC09_012950 [Saccharomycopsis crataegensis]
MPIGCQNMSASNRPASCPSSDPQQASDDIKNEAMASSNNSRPTQRSKTFPFDSIITIYRDNESEIPCPFADPPLMRLSADAINENGIHSKAVSISQKSAETVISFNNTPFHMTDAEDNLTNCVLEDDKDIVEDYDDDFLNSVDDPPDGDATPDYSFVAIQSSYDEEHDSQSNINANHLSESNGNLVRDIINGGTMEVLFSVATTCELSRDISNSECIIRRSSKNDYDNEEYCELNDRNGDGPIIPITKQSIPIPGRSTPERPLKTGSGIMGLDKDISTKVEEMSEDENCERRSPSSRDFTEISGINDTAGTSFFVLDDEPDIVSHSADAKTNHRDTVSDITSKGETKLSTEAILSGKRSSQVSIESKHSRKRKSTLADLCAKASASSARYRVGLSKRQSIEHLHSRFSNK